MSDGADAALGALRALGWRVQKAERRRRLPRHILDRYPGIPADVRDFLEGLEVCARADERVWFLASRDYADGGEPAFGWDEWEKLDLDAAGAAGGAEVRAFWDAHLPILQAVDGDYAGLAVVVNPAAADYGAVVRTDAPDFTEAATISGSFADFLAVVAAAGSAPPDLTDLLASAEDESRLLSAPLGPFGRLKQRLQSWRPFERYRVAVVLYEVTERPLHTWETWSQIMPFMTALVGKLGAEAVIRPRQAGDADNWLRFGRLTWNEANNRTWTTRYLGDPALAGKVAFHRTEIWAPSHAASFEARRGPELFCLVEKNQADDSQGFVLAVRKDVLPQVDVAADAVIFAVRDVCGLGACKVFDRTWGEFGRFGSLMVANGLDWTGPHAVLQWANEHPRASRPSFRWRRS